MKDGTERRESLGRDFDTNIMKETKIKKERIRKKSKNKKKKKKGKFKLNLMWEYMAKT